MILYKDTDLKIDIKYLYKSKSKNFIFYICSQRPECNGRGKININTKEFYITNLCDKQIVHNKITYEEYVNYIEKNDIENIDFSAHYIQKYYVYYVINKNNNIGNPELKKEYFTKYHIKLDLSLSILSTIRNNIINKYKNIDLLSLINKIELSEFDFKNYVLDINYKYKKNKNNIIDRYQRIIIIFNLINMNL